MGSVIYLYLNNDYKTFYYYFVRLNFSRIFSSILNIQYFIQNLKYGVRNKFFCGCILWLWGNLKLLIDNCIAIIYINLIHFHSLLSNHNLFCLFSFLKHTFLRNYTYMKDPCISFNNSNTSYSYSESLYIISEK